MPAQGKRPSRSFTRRPAWFDDAACSPRNNNGKRLTETFFAHDSRAHARFDRSPEVERAKAICRSCPVTAECLDYALTPPQLEYGTYGGLTEQERRRLIRAQKRQERTA